jgi:tetratricopeptide (TPR) repeat protein
MRLKQVPVSFLLLCLAAFAWLPAGVAHATPSPQQRALARELYTKGQQLFREGDYTAAEHSFEEAYRVAPTPVVLLSIAECQVRTEQFERAAETLETYLREKPDAKDKTEVRTQIETLRHKPASLTVSSNIAGADIWVDGNDTGMSTPADLSLSPGVHTVTLVRDGYVRTDQSIRLSPAGRDTIRFTMMPEAQAPVVAAAAATTTEQPAEPESKRHFGPAFWAATGVGIAALGAGIGLGVTALKKVDEFNANPTTKGADQGERIALAADVCYGVAGAAAVTALVVYFTSGRSSSSEAEPQPQAFQLAPSFARHGAGIAARAQF